MEFLTPEDVANRALQHCGAEMMDPVEGFSENTKRARQTSFAYGKQRRAELRRNVWRFAIRPAVLRPVDTTTMLLRPTLYSATTIYFVGSIVADANGALWSSRIPDNLGNDPTNTDIQPWEPYFGPLSVHLYDSTTTYFSSELVYTTAGDGKYRVFRSLENANADDPATATAWDETVTYMKGQVVEQTAIAYLSLIDLNLNNDPSLAPALYDSAATYSIGDQVGGSDGMIYDSLTNSNSGNDPTTDGGSNWDNTGDFNPWSSDFVGGTGSLKWRQIGGAEFPHGVALSAMNLIYPIGAGPSTQSGTQNVYRLPNGYLRAAPQDPKAGSYSYLGAPYGLLYNDWKFRGDYIVSMDVQPIIFQFVADVTDVSTFDDMFCEGLAARIALQVCEPLTQSTSKLGAIAKLYDVAISQARTVNGIETGSEEPPIDDWITCRA